MTEISAAPSSVTTATDSPVIAGDPDTLLGDGSDLTYVDLTTRYASPFNEDWYRIDGVDGAVEVVIPAGATDIEYLRVEFRVSATDPDDAPGGTRLRLSLHDVDFERSFDLHGGAGIPIPTDGGVHAMESDTYYSYAPELGTIEEFLTSGDALLRISVFTPPNGPPDGTWTNTARVFEVRLVMAYALSRRPAPPLRLWPRSDGLELSTAERVWPPPDAQGGTNLRVIGGAP